MRKSLGLKKSVIAVALTLVAPQWVFAQEAASDKKADKIEKVVITGSNIKRSEMETASPVQIISRKEIMQTGASNVRELLDTITSGAPGTLSDKTGNGSFASGASGVNLRDLGKSSTLVLLNSRRIANYGFADGAQENFANIDSIPADIIDRVEILKDGASAIYGSDAVAGVINIITLKEFKGVSLHASAQTSLLNSAQDRNQTVSATFGFGDLNSQGFNVMGHVEAFHRNAYTIRDVITSVEPWYKKYVDPNFGLLSTYSYPGNFISDELDIAQPVKGCAPQNIIGGLCRFDQFARAEAVPGSDRVNAFFSGRKTINENLTLLAELQLSKTKTVYNNTPARKVPGDISTWYDARRQQVLTFIEPDLPAAHPDNPFGVDMPLRYRFADDVSLFKSTTEAQQYRFVIGLEGTHFGWDWNGSIGTMASTVDQLERGQRHFKNYVDAVTSGEYRFGGKNSPELLMRMFPNLTTAGKSTENFFDLRGSREIMTLPGGKLAMAAGLELRHETFLMRDGENVLNAEIVARGGTDISGSRNLSAAFVEVVAPFSKQLEGSFALRADKSSTAPASLVPKVGMRYSVNDSLTLRGTYAHGFRSPNLAESGRGNVSAFQNGIDDPKRCATANAIYNAVEGAAGASDVDRIDIVKLRDDNCQASASILVVPNPNLEAEKSKSFTLGMIWEPIKDVSVLFDYFHIVRRNEIGTKSISQVLADEDVQPGSVARLALTPDDARWAAKVKELTGQDLRFSVGPLSGVRQIYQNLAQSRRSGIDLEVATRWNLGAYGRLTAGLETTYMLDYRSWDSTLQSLSENLAGNYGHSRLRAVGKFSLSAGNWTWGARINYFSGTNLIDDRYDTNDTVEGCASRGIPASDCRIPSDTTVDLSANYTGLKNTVVTLNLQNALNRSALVDPRTSDSAPARGRIVKLSVEYKF